jgi:hypothetical protein
MVLQPGCQKFYSPDIRHCFAAIKPTMVHDTPTMQQLMGKNGSATKIQKKTYSPRLACQQKKHMALQHSQKQKVYSSNRNKLQCKCEYANANSHLRTTVWLCLTPKLQPGSMNYISKCNNYRVNNGFAARMPKVLQP